MKYLGIEGVAECYPFYFVDKNDSYALFKDDSSTSAYFFTNTWLADLRLDSVLNPFIYNGTILLVKKKKQR